MSDSMITIPNCACGERMKVTNVADVFVCLNCDGLQPQEVQVPRKPRIKSPQDHAYASEMRRREKAWYAASGNGRTGGVM